MELRQIEAFVTAAMTGNFTRAAAQLHLSQSAVSQQIRRLEEEVGEPLFIRTNRRVRLSYAGKDLLPAAQELLRWRSLFLEKSRPSPLGVAGQLTVGTSAAATAYLWARVYQAFAQEHPRIEMNIRTMQRTQDTIAHVASGDLDVGFAPLPLGKADLESRVLGIQEALLTVPARHRLGKLRTVRGKDLVGERFILYEPQISIRWLTDEFFRREGITPKIILESNDTHLIKAMVEVGFGIAFLPSWCLARETKERRLQAVPVSGGRLIQEFGSIFRRRGLSPPGRAFVEFCAAHRNLLPRIAQIKDQAHSSPGSQATSRIGVRQTRQG